MTQMDRIELLLESVLVKLCDDLPSTLDEVTETLRKIRESRQGEKLSWAKDQLTLNEKLVRDSCVEFLSKIEQEFFDRGFVDVYTPYSLEKSNINEIFIPKREYSSDSRVGELSAKINEVFHRQVDKSLYELLDTEVFPRDNFLRKRFEDEVLHPKTLEYFLNL